MAFVLIRDMRTRPGEVWQQLQDAGELIVTSSGRAFALMIATEGDNFEDLLLALRRARAQLTVSRLRKQAVARGLDRLSADVIEAKISQMRQERRQ